MGQMSVGGARLALVESEGGMLVEAYKSRLEMVLHVMNNGRIGGSGGYGSEGHKAAIDRIEQQIKDTREAFIAQESEDHDT